MIKKQYSRKQGNIDLPRNIYSVNVFGLVKCKLLKHRAQNVETVKPSYTDNNVDRARK
jgi:hypothetical protein